MAKFRRKHPGAITDAVRWTYNWAEMEEFLGRFSVNQGRIVVRTLEGDMYAELGDWIIKGIKGEFYPCKPDIFEMTYEPVGV